MNIKPMNKLILIQKVESATKSETVDLLKEFKSELVLKTDNNRYLYEVLATSDDLLTSIVPGDKIIIDQTQIENVSIGEVDMSFIRENFVIAFIRS